MNITQQVESILRHSRQARNSDDELEIIFMQKSGMNLTPEQIKIFKEMPTMETIRRTRQKLQEQGKYEADHSVNEARYAKYQNVRANIQSEDPEKLLEAQGKIVLPWGQ